MRQAPGPAAAVESHCANCGEPLRGRYCSACGQEARDPARHPLRELLTEWLGDVFSFDSRLFRTLGPLVAKPGLLTHEYLAGRRARYVPPLRLFVFISLVMFVVLGVTGVQFSWKVTSGDEVVVASGRQQERLRQALEEPAEPTAGEASDDDEVLSDPDEINRRLLEGSPQVMFVLAPVFAFLVWLLHRRRAPYYMAHLIFSLHVHSFWFLVVTAAALADLALADLEPGKLILLALAPYLYLALRRVYGRGRLATLWRTVALGAAHLVVYIVAMVALLLLTVVWA